MKYLAILLALGASTLTAQSGQANPRKLDSLAAAPVLANRVVGLVAAVVKGNDTLLTKAYGKADVEWDVPMTTDAMFEIGSIAKQFAAAAILQLRDAGRLSLDDEITKWLPNVSTGPNKVTLRRMLSHTSGINSFADVNEWEINFFTPSGYPRDSVYRLIKVEPFRFIPGQAQAYSNSAFWLLGLVVEKASGMRYEDYVQQKFFDALGMKRSMYCNSSANVPRRAHGYGLQGGTIRRAPVFNYGIVFAPGAVCSTAGDLVTWLKALHGGKVLSPKSYTEMTTPAMLDDGTALRYGMGIKVQENYRGLRSIGHGGTAPGFRADAAWYPDAQMAVVVLVNTSPTNLPPAGVGNQLANEVLPWKRPTMTFYTGDAAPFVGRYEHVIGGNQGPRVIEVTQSPNGLAFSVNGSPSEPFPWAEGLTFYANEAVTITFQRANGNSGPVTGLHTDDAGNHRIFKKQ